MIEQKYTMSINLNVLNHLGIKLYSNVPAVLSEVVANSWDADATNVDIEIESNRITITDNGHGMTLQDINDKYLMVGYRRREHDVVRTTKYDRPVMGRKGIGKLSLFSIADTVAVETVKGTEKHGFVMSAKEIEQQIKNEEQIGNEEQISQAKDRDYHPKAMQEDEISLDVQDAKDSPNKGATRIILTGLKKGVSQAPGALRKRLARRFSIIGTKDFMVSINEDSVDITDRDYFHKLHYLWYFGDKSIKYAKLCDQAKLKHPTKRPGNVEVEDGDGTKACTYQVTGWIGTVKEAPDVKDPDDNLNKIVIMVRGKLAQEDILEDFSEGGLYTKYIIGEIHADFLDLDKEDDIATSNRQEIIKDDPRYAALQRWVQGELKHIESQWKNRRNEEGEKEASQIPAINEWLKTLGVDTRKLTKSLFGKIAQLPMEREDERQELYQYGALAFEGLVHKDRLSELENLSPENIEKLTRIFAHQTEIEAAHYYKIVDRRLSVIEGLDTMVKESTIERMIQDYLANNLWLLDPSWERAADAVHVEESVTATFKKLDNDSKLRKDELSQEERRGRIDIRYKMMYGHHVIIELKRPEVKVNDYDLMRQVDKYRTALLKELKRHGHRDESVEIVCIVGEELRQWTSPIEYQKSVNSLADKDIRVVLYQELIKDARQIYQEFLKKKEEAGSLCKLIKNIDIDIQQKTEE